LFGLTKHRVGADSYRPEGVRRYGRTPYSVLTAPQQVAAAIKRDILEGVLKPGDKLPAADQLAALFGVSRPTVRAGLQELCAAQILAVQRGRSGGYRVGNMSLSVLESSVSELISLSLVVETLDPAQFFEVRYTLELLIAEVAAVKRSESSLAQLKEVRHQAEETTERQDAFDLDLRFHRLLAQATENNLMVTFEGAMIAVLHRLLGDGSRISPEDALGGLIGVVDAVQARDPIAARRAMQCHLRGLASFYGLRPGPHALEALSS
jgi:GntR family transcriptional regulator, transcriptional repressor for pyruvate dehydrogenase complex